MVKCPICNSSDFIYDKYRGIVFCAKCGYVIEEHVIDLGPEWRGVDRSGKPLSRASPISAALPGYGLFMNVINMNRSRLRLVPSIMLFNSSERNIMMLRSIAKQIVANMGLPESIVDEVILNYRALVKMGYRGKIKETATALIYIVCRKRNMPCTIKELLKNSDVNIKGFNKAYMQIANLMNIKGVYNDEQIMNMVLRILNAINFDNKDIKHRVMLLIRNLIEKGKDNGLFSGKTLSSTVAAMIYIALLIYNMKVRQKEIASIANVTDVTIRNRYNELLNHIHFMVIL